MLNTQTFSPQPTISPHKAMQVRSPACYWRKDDMRRRAYIALEIVKLDGVVTKRAATIGRGFYRKGERHYANVTESSLQRLAALFPFKVI